MIDNATWKWICRFYFRRYLYISFPSEKGEERVEIKAPVDIFQYAERLVSTLKWVLAKYESA